MKNGTIIFQRQKKNLYSQNCFHIFEIKHFNKRTTNGLELFKSIHQMTFKEMSDFNTNKSYF